MTFDKAVRRFAVDRGNFIGNGWLTANDRSSQSSDMILILTQSSPAPNPHHVRTAETCHSRDVHHRRILLSGCRGKADRSHSSIPSGRDPTSRSTRGRALTYHRFSFTFRLGAVLIPTSALASGKVSDRTNGDGRVWFFFFLFEKFFFPPSSLECSLYRLPASELGMIVDKGSDFPQTIDAALRKYGESMWFFREQPGQTTARALNSYIGDHKKWVSSNITIPPLIARA